MRESLVSWENYHCKLDISMVKAEICTNFNINMECSEFAHHIKDKKNLLEADKYNEKYNYNKKV